MGSKTPKGEGWRKILILLAVSSFSLLSVSPLYAQRSIFRSVGDKTDQRLKTVDQKPSEPKNKKEAPKPALDPLSLLGERPKTLAQSIQIPPEFGRLSESYQGNPTPLIIHIQDVHVHYEAQKNLANILDKLVKENGLRLILVEGGSGDTSLSFLRSEASKEKRLEVAEKYLKLGKISGEEYLDIISDNPITLWGIEDEDLYNKNLDVFFKVDAIKGKAYEVAKTLKAIVETLQVNIYSPAIKELERKKYDYEEGKTQAVDFYQYLGGLSQNQKGDLSRYPNFKNFLEASLLEKQIDFQKVDGQHQALIGKLTQVLSKGDLTALAEKGLKYKLNEAGPGDYYGFLKELLKKSDPAPATHQDLDRYIDYVILYADRDHVELFREGKILEKEIKNRLYTSPDERTLSEISDKLELLLNFLELNLSPDDLKTYQADRQAFLVRGWKKFLLDKMNQYQVTVSFPADVSIVDNNWGLLESFYELGMKRDSALVKNALLKINAEHVDVVVLIAGGFHTDQITRLLKQQNYSYMVIAPKITQASNLELYHKILKEKAKPETPADENLRQLPALERGVPRFLKGDLERRAAQDGQGRQPIEQLLSARRQAEQKLNEAFTKKDEKEIKRWAGEIGRINRQLGQKYAKDGGRGKETAQELQDKIAQLTSQIETAPPSSKFLLERERETLQDELALRRRRGSSGLTARDGGYKILGDPALVTLAKDVEMGKGVVLDVTEGKGRIVIQEGAKIRGPSYLKTSNKNSVVIGKNALVDSSYLEGVLVEDNASVAHAMLVTSETVEDWKFDREGKFKVSGSRTRVGEGSKVSGYAMLLNTAVGKGTDIEGGVYKNSEIGEQNRLSHTKMTLVHTEQKVTLKGTPQLPLEFSEAWLGYGFYSDQQAFIDSTLHPNEIVSLRFNTTKGQLEPHKRFNLPAISHVGRNVVYSSYSGTLNPLEIHRNGLSSSYFVDAISNNKEKTHIPPVRLLGIDGTESSSHGFLLVDPLSILSPWLRWIALPSREPSSDSFLLATDRNLSHTMPFSVIGAPVVEGNPVLDDWGLAPPGAAKFGLSRKDIRIPFLFTYSPDTIFRLMGELTTQLQKDEKSKYDDFVVEMLETGRALAQKELAGEKEKYREDQDRNRIAQLKKWIEAYGAHIESGAWKFENGEPVGWRVVNEEWVHQTFDLKKLAQEVDGVGANAYHQKLFKDLFEKEPPIPFENWENYEPILTKAHLPKLGPSAVIGPEVVIEEGAVIGPGVILEGKTVIRKGAQVFGSHLKDVTVGERTFLWGVTLEETEVKEETHLSLVFASKSHFGSGVRLASSRIEGSKIGDGTEGNGALVRNSSVGRRNTLEPYATLVEVDSLDDSVIGSRVSHSQVAGLTDHHLASRILYLSTLPILFSDEKGEQHQVPNVTNWGGGSYVNPELPGRVYADSAFVATNTPLGLPDTDLLKAFEERRMSSIDIRIGFGSIVAGGVRMGEHLLPFTQKYGPGPENDRIGGMLFRPDVVMRHIISKTKTKSAASNSLLVDKLVEAKIRLGLEQAREELKLVEEGKTYHPYDRYKLHSKEQLEEGIEIFEQNLDGRWRMENHRFVGGFWLYTRGRYSWHVPEEDGVQPAQGGGEITFASNIGRGREGQEDRIVVHSIPGWGDLLAVIDGHVDEQAAHLVKQKLPSIFENALHEKEGDIPETEKDTFKALDELTKNMNSDSGLVLSMVVIPSTEKKAYGAVLGDAPVLIENEKGELFLGPEHNVIFNEVERENAVRRGAHYDKGERLLSRGVTDPSGIRPSRTLGDKRFRSFLSQEPELFEVPLGEKSVVLLASDGLVSDVKGKGADRVKELIQGMHLEFSAQVLVHKRLQEKKVDDNVSAIVYLPKVSPRSSEEIRGFFKVYQATKAAEDGAKKYVAKELAWLLEHGQFFHRSASQTLKEASPKLREKKDAEFLLFHSSILREDLGESFSLALDHLAEETRNPLNNEQSVFRVVLLIDDPSMKFEDVEAYLSRHHLRREQFYAVVTHDLLEGYGDRETLRKYGREPSLVYRIKVGDFLDTSLSEERLRARWGDDSNVVIVASAPEAKDWTKYIMLKRFVVWKENLKARLVVYQPRRGGEDTEMNLAPLLVTAAAEFVGTSDPEASLKDIKGLLTFIGSKIYVEPAPVEDPYFRAYVEYLNSV